jgi:hypothetical protein
MLHKPRTTPPKLTNLSSCYPIRVKRLLEKAASISSLTPERFSYMMLVQLTSYLSTYRGCHVEADQMQLSKPPPQSSSTKAQVRHHQVLRTFVKQPETARAIPTAEHQELLTTYRQAPRIFLASTPAWRPTPKRLCILHLNSPNPKTKSLLAKFINLW